MDNFFEIASKVSTPLGLAGIIAASLFLIAREILKKNIFPALTKNLSSDIIRLLIERFFVLALVSVVLGFLGFALSLIIKGTQAQQTPKESPTPTVSQPVKKQEIVINLISARPKETKIGGAESSQQEIRSILTNVVRPALETTCFSNPVEREINVTVDALIYLGSGGYANNVSWKGNIDDRYEECLRDVFRGTRFPEPAGEKDRHGLSENDYWITATVRVIPK
jgi:hypothetical protein